MIKGFSQIEFYFPEGAYEDKNVLVSSIISMMKQKGSIKYSGYANLNFLQKGLIEHVGDGRINQFRHISIYQKEKIKKIITKTIEKCNQKLTIPTKNFIFVYPYLPTEKDKVFEGVMAVAVYSCVFHVFIDLDRYTEKSLENTVAHELNHTIYYYHHYDGFGHYALLDEILLEGLAENFREQYFDFRRTPWADALSKKEALEILKESKKFLISRNRKTIDGFLFGNNKYKRWTGYSTGYWLVKEFLRDHNMSWDRIMKLDRDSFIDYLNERND